MDTNTTKGVIEFRLSAVDQEELAYNTLGYELEVTAQDAERIELTGDQMEMRRWVQETWAPLAQSKGWYGRLLIWNGVAIEY